MKKLLISSVVCTVVLICGTAYAADSTPWFDRDNPDGKGDYEDTKSLFSISCRFKDTKKPVEGVGYHCELPTGGWCKNAETVPAGKCRDIEVMFSWPAATPTHSGAAPYQAGSTGWIDRDNPGGVGDYETTKDIFNLKCRFVGGSPLVTGSPNASYHCELPTGGWCENTPAGVTSCKDIEVQYSW